MYTFYLLIYYWYFFDSYDNERWLVIFNKLKKKNDSKVKLKINKNKKRKKMKETILFYLKKTNS